MLLAGGATAAWWGSHLSLSGSQISSIRYWMLFAGMAVLVVVLSIVIYRTQQKLREALAHPPKLSDDYTFLTERGFWVHNQNGSRVCANCMASGVITPLAMATLRGYNYEAGDFHSAPIWRCGRKLCNAHYRRLPNDK